MCGFSGTRRDISIPHRLLSMPSPTTPFTLPTGTIDIILRALFSIRSRNTVRDVYGLSWILRKIMTKRKYLYFYFFIVFYYPGSVVSSGITILYHHFGKVGTIPLGARLLFHFGMWKDKKGFSIFFCFSGRFFGVWDLPPGSDSVKMADPEMNMDSIHWYFITF